MRKETSMNECIVTHHSGFSCIQAKPLLLSGLTHAFTTRAGGISENPFHSLNMGLHVQDSNECVLHNRELMARELGFSLGESVWGEQVHGCACAQVGVEEKGHGARSFATTIPGVDGLYTSLKNLPLVGVFADCVPVFLYDSKKQSIGLVHAGWKGIVARNTEVTIKAMESDLGTNRKDLLVYIGPCISEKRFEVDASVKALFLEAGYGKRIACRNGKNYVDLRNCLWDSLLAFGVPRDNICVSSYCTYEEETLFFSHRRDHGRTGRMAGIIMMNGD